MGSPATSGYRRSGDLPVPGREWLADPVAVSPRCSRAWWRSFLLVGPGSGGGQPQVLSRMVALLPAGGSGFGVAVSPRCSRAWWRSFLLRTCRPLHRPVVYDRSQADMSVEAKCLKCQLEPDLSLSRARQCKVDPTL